MNSKSWGVGVLGTLLCVAVPASEARAECQTVRLATDGTSVVLKNFLQMDNAASSLGGVVALWGWDGSWNAPDYLSPSVALVGLHNFSIPENASVTDLVVYGRDTATMASMTFSLKRAFLTSESESIIGSWVSTAGTSWPMPTGLLPFTYTDYWYSWWVQIYYTSNLSAGEFLSAHTITLCWEVL